MHLEEETIKEGTEVEKTTRQDWKDKVNGQHTA